MSTHYTPGGCNINEGEIAKRKLYGLLNTVLGLLYVAMITYFDLPMLLKMGLVFPIFGAVLSFWQAKQRFCAGFALAHMYEDGSGQITRVKDNKQQQKDQERAVKMVIGVALASAVATGLILVLLSQFTSNFLKLELK